MARTESYGDTSEPRERPPLEAYLDDIERSIARTSSNLRRINERTEAAGRALRCEPTAPTPAHGGGAMTGTSAAPLTGIARLQSLAKLADVVADGSGAVRERVDETLNLVS